MAYAGDNEGDLPMHDADLDPYNKQKYEDMARDYPVRPHHRHRGSSQLIPQEETSAAARRYSPMKLSPALSYSPYVPNSTAGTSPTRPGLYSSHSQTAFSSPRMSRFIVIRPCSSDTFSLIPPGGFGIIVHDP